MKTIALLFAALCASTFTHAAEAIKVELTRYQALELFIALSRIEPGVSPANTVKIADNINTLRAIAEATQKGAQKLLREQRQLPAGGEHDELALKLAEDFQAEAEQRGTFELVPLAFTDAEIKEAKITGALLALVKERLKPEPAKK